VARQRESNWKLCLASGVWDQLSRVGGSLLLRLKVHECSETLKDSQLACDICYGMRTAIVFIILRVFCMRQLVISRFRPGQSGVRASVVARSPLECTTGIRARR